MGNLDKIELTKEEVQAVLNTLAEMKFKEVAGLVQFFNTKLQPKKEVIEPGKGEQENG